MFFNHYTYFSSSLELSIPNWVANHLIFKDEYSATYCLELFPSWKSTLISDLASLSSNSSKRWSCQDIAASTTISYGFRWVRVTKNMLVSYIKCYENNFTIINSFSKRKIKIKNFITKNWLVSCVKFDTMRITKSWLIS